MNAGFVSSTPPTYVYVYMYVCDILYFFLIDDKSIIALLILEQWTIYVSFLWLHCSFRRGLMCSVGKIPQFLCIWL